MGKTIIVSSHILHELAQFCSHIGIIEAGRMVANGSLNDIYRALSLRRTIHLQLVNASPAAAGLDPRAPASRQPGGAARPHRRATARRPDRAGRSSRRLAHPGGARVRMFQPDAMDMETAFMKLTEGKVA
ncbi:MAG: hypothetical protein WDN28_22490 [Chthoniobacter sp.]